MADWNKLIEEHYDKAANKLSLKRLCEVVEGVINEKLNEGDVVEGIFAIAVALSLAHDKVDPAKVEAWRKKVEPAMFRKERQVETIADLSDISTKDRIKVVLEIRLKSPKTVGGSFGAEYDTVSDVPSIRVMNIV